MPSGKPSRSQPEQQVSEWHSLPGFSTQIQGVDTGDATRFTNVWCLLSRSYVANTLVSWLHSIVKTYEFDGVRIDTIPEVSHGGVAALVVCLFSLLSVLDFCTCTLVSRAGLLTARLSPSHAVQVHPSFWDKFTDDIGVYCVGEVDNGDPSYVAPYQNHVGATLNYPMYWTLRHVFQVG